MLAKPPSKEHSIDRYPDKYGNYEPSNVRWATQMQQQSNRRDNIILNYNGKQMILAEWARYLNINHSTLQYHLGKGLSIKEIIFLL